MATSSGLVYEVTLTIEDDIVSEFDAWLAQHVEEMLELPGFESANVFTIEKDQANKTRRVTHYHLESEDALEDYFSTYATTMRQSGIAHFGDKFSANRRVLRETEIVDGQISAVEFCRNCGTVMSGQYCGHCGQRSRSRLISLWQLINEAVGDLFELDSRLWRTLAPLLTKPGKLTRDYLEGRRVRFMPPFRTYLVLSIIFFVVVLFDPKSDFAVLFDPEAASPAEISVADTSAAQMVADEMREELIGELAADGTIPTELLPNLDQLSDTVEEDESAADAEESSTNCVIETEADEMPAWLGSRLTESRLKVLCERILVDDGKQLANNILDNIPAALIFLMPAIALVLKILYPLSRRFYVEHLLFVVHYHAFFFLFLILMTVFSKLVELLRVPELVVTLAMVAAAFYAPVYLYKAMRRVYVQGHWATTAKFVILNCTYIFGLILIFGVTVLIAVLSI